MLKTKDFARWAKKERIQSSQLYEAAKEIHAGLIDGELGRGLIKKRIARSGQGKRRGHRTLLAFNEGKRAIFIFGFSKKDRENISTREAAAYQKLAEYYFGMSDIYLHKLLNENELIEVKHEEGCQENG